MTGRKAALVPPTELPAKPKACAARNVRSSRSGGSASERISAAALELASGIGEAASAAAELQRAMDEISRGAEEAASAAQESSGAIGSLVQGCNDAREQALGSLGRTEQLQSSFVDTGAQIEGSIVAIEPNAERQLGTVAVIVALEEKAGGITAISRDVSEISEQTELLAVNAALEAVRAGDHGHPQ